LPSEIMCRTHIFILVFVLLALLFSCTGPLPSSDSLKPTSLQTLSTTEKKLETATAYAREIGSAAVLVLHKGQIIFSYGDITRKYMCHSIRKPFLGALYGMYVEKNSIDIDATLEMLNIDDIPPSITPAEKQATVRDLLLSRSGVYHEAAGEHQSMVNARPERGSHAPGTFFYYNNWDFNVLGSIFEQVTSKRIFQTFDEDIAKRIGMVDFSPDDCTYVYEQSKSKHPAYFFRMSTRDMAQFGLLYQNFGQWDGKQIVPKQWIRESTAIYPVENTGGDPYGYLWRIIPKESGLGYGFYHSGLGVHLLAVLPDQELVLVHRVDTDRNFDITWPEIKTLLEMIVSAHFGSLE
jgi:CubicO group peptidase (beta-lactamase class C family)